MQDWWQVDQLSQFVSKGLVFDFAYEKAKQYVESELPFVRRWGYVLFMPSLVKDVSVVEKILLLFKDDEAYYVQMAQAWLISSLAVYAPEKTWKYLVSCSLHYNIVGKAIQKINDSFRISEAYKMYFNEIRNLDNIRHKKL